jgi:hypothetical protein
VLQALKTYLQKLVSFSEEEWLKLIAAIEVRRISRQTLFYSRKIPASTLPFLTTEL